MADLLAAALGYAARGWPVFPCRADKTPLTAHGVLDATTDPEKVREWWSRWPGANVAVSAGDAGLLVLDFDPGSSPEDVEARMGAPLPDTALVAATPRGGEHWYYALDPGELVASSASRVGDHVDVRAFHGYVLLPPSATGDGTYEWVEEGRPARRPDALIALANRARSRSDRRDEWTIEPDLAENVALATRWLREQAKPAVEGRGGDNTAYATAAMMKSYGVSEALARDLMWEHWNPRCDPPWPADEWDHFAAKVRNGYSYNTSPPGNVTPAYHVARTAAAFKPVPTEADGGDGHELRAGRFRIVDREGLARVRPPQWLVPGLVVEGSHALLVGSFGTFKTFLALDLALTIAAGVLPEAVGGPEDWRGPWRTNRPGPVLFAAGEGRPGLRQRVEAWEALHLGGERVEDFMLTDPVPRITDEPATVEAFIKLALKMRPGGYRLVVVDTVGRAMQGANENQQEHASSFTALVEHLQRELGCSVLALHHTGHGRADSPRGSTVFSADADTMVLARREENALEVRLTMSKQKDAEAWSADRMVALEKVDLPAGGSLAVVQAVSRDTATGGRAAEAFREKVTLDVVDRFATEVLATNKAADWSNNRLAEAMMTHNLGGPDGPRMGFQKRKITGLLDELKRSEGTLSSGYWRAPSGGKAGYWRWAEKLTP